MTSQSSHYRGAAKTTLHAGAIVSAKMGYSQGTKFLVNETGNASLLFVPQPEKNGYRLEYMTQEGKIVNTYLGQESAYTCKL